MEKEKNAPTRTLVIPGEVLGEGNLKAGKNTFRQKNKIYAAQMGFKTVSSNFVNVIPLSGRYLPKPDDLVIGIIQSVSPSTWLVDINSPYPAPLHVNEVPWRVDFGDTARYLNAGNTVLARIFIVDEVKRIQVTMKDQGSRKLSGGQLIEISPTKVPRIIGKGGSMISMIKQKTQCRVFVGQNGRIWIDGEPDNIRIAVNAIQFIQDNSHKFGLTEAVERYLDETISGKKTGAADPDRPAIEPRRDTAMAQPAPREQPDEPSPDTEPSQIIPPVAPTLVPHTESSVDVRAPISPTPPIPGPKPITAPPTPSVPYPNETTFRPPMERSVQSGQMKIPVAAPGTPVAPTGTQEKQEEPSGGEQKKRPGDQVLKNEEFERMSD